MRKLLGLVIAFTLAVAMWLEARPKPATAPI